MKKKKRKKEKIEEKSRKISDCGGVNEGSYKVIVVWIRCDFLFPQMFGKWCDSNGIMGDNITWNSHQKSRSITLLSKRTPNSHQCASEISFSQKFVEKKEERKKRREKTDLVKVRVDDKGGHCLDWRVSRVGWSSGSSSSVIFFFFSRWLSLSLSLSHLVEVSLATKSRDVSLCCWWSNRLIKFGNHAILGRWRGINGGGCRHALDSWYFLGSR